jgi:hypothetical protein
MQNVIVPFEQDWIQDEPQETAILIQFVYLDYQDLKQDKDSCVERTW